MAKPHERQSEPDEDVSPLQWMDGDMSSPDGEAPTTPHHHGYRSSALDPRGSQVGSEDMEEDDDDEDDDDDELDDNNNNNNNNNGPKRRGPKRKRMTKGRQERFRARRVKANARERSRMHGLNDALENLRSIMPCHSKTQKLSKIETLRLARNYICALSEALEAGQSVESRAFVETLCKGLSQPTSNLVAGCLQLCPPTVPGDQSEDRHGEGPRGSAALGGVAVGGSLGYSSSGLPSPPYGNLDSAHLLHLRALKGMAGAEQQSPSDYVVGVGGLGTPPYDGPPTPPLSIGGGLVAKQESSPHYGSSQHYSPSLMEQAAARGQVLYQAPGYEVHLDGPFDSAYHPAHMAPSQMIYRH